MKVGSKLAGFFLMIAIVNAFTFGNMIVTIVALVTMWVGFFLLLKGLGEIFNYLFNITETLE